MKDRESTARSRELGAELRRIRERAGHTGADLADLLGWSQSRISRLESGKRGASERQVAVLLASCQARPDEIDYLLGLCQEAYDRSWLQFHQDTADNSHTLILHETTATRISEYSPLAIPDLLQTRGYASSVLHPAALAADKPVELWIRARLNRQAVFQQENPPTFVFFISEQALRSPIGGTGVMNTQLLHLVLMSSQPGLQLRVLPLSVDPSGLLGGPFRLLESSEHLPLAYIQNHTTSLFLEEPNDIATYRAILDQLAEHALNEDQSRKLLAQLASRYDLPDPHDDDHDHAGGTTGSSQRPSEGRPAP